MHCKQGPKGPELYRALLKGLIKWKISAKSIEAFLGSNTFILADFSYNIIFSRKGPI